MNRESVQQRIDEEVCNNTIQKLQDENLMSVYIKCASVKNKVKELTDILNKYKIPEHKINSITNAYLTKIIPPGTKSVIRGNMFNKIVKSKIESMNLPSEFDIKFESKSSVCETEEIPDWYILDKSTQRIMIGMNQLSIFGGGHQYNRGSKYLSFDNDENKKLVCVICNKVDIKNTLGKTFKMYQKGFESNTLCYLGGLQRIINLFFKLK